MQQQDQPDVRATGERSIALGRDALGSILATGDDNQFFIGAYERLSDAYLNPSSIYQDCDLEHFVGRRDVLHDIDEFLARHDRGYLEIEGGLGVGKTTLLAWLAAHRGYAHHFVQLMPNKGDVGVAMRNLSAQLIRAWDMSSWAVGGVLPSSASRPEFFYDLLEAAAQRRDDLRPEEPIVIVVDALDEAGQPQAGNRLALPRRLPAGVYVIVAHRDVYIALNVDPPKRVLELTAAQSLDDTAEYLRKAVRRREIASRLDAAGVREDDFVETLLRKTAGLWLYLSYVMVEIETGSRSAADLEGLPGGLWQYYEQFWRGWQADHPDTWREVHQPLLSTLGAARENLSAGFLAGLAGVRDVGAVEALLDESWRPFLVVDDGPDEVRYGISQASFRAFLEGRVDEGLLNQVEQRTVRRTAEATRRAHGAIADRYLTAWGGLDASLPRLKDATAAQMDGGYGLRHLTEHLVGARRDDDLHRLLWASWESSEVRADAPVGRVVNTWRQAQESAGLMAVYLNDVASAWHLVERTSSEQAEAGQLIPGVALELRYALLSASVSSMAANVPPALLVALTELGRLSTNEALAYARRGPDALPRIEALLALMGSIEPHLVVEVLREALVSVRAVEDEQLRVGALTRLVPHLPATWRGEVLDVATSVVDDFWHGAAVKAVDAFLGAGAEVLDDAPGEDPGDESWHDPALALPHAVWIARTLRGRHAEALARLAARLPERPTGDELAEALAAARRIPQDRWRAEALTAVAGRVQDVAARAELLEEALASARAVGDSAQHAQALGSLARRLGRAGLVDEALATAREIRDPYRRAATLADLATSERERPGVDVIAELARALVSVGDLAQRARLVSHHPTVLRVLAAAEGDDVLVEARRVIPDQHWRALVHTALLKSADGIHDATAEGSLREAYSAAAGLDPYGRADVLVRLAPQLPAELVDEARTLADAIGEADERAMAVGALSVRYAELGRSSDAVTAADAIADGHRRAEALAGVAEELATTGSGADALAAARAVPYAHWRSAVLARVAAHRPAGEGDGVLDEALACARGLDSAAAVAEALLLVAEQVDGPAVDVVLEEAIAAARRVPGPHDRARTLARAAQVLAGRGRPKWALDVLAGIDDQLWRADALCRVADHVDDPAIAKGALAVASGLDDRLQRAAALVALLPTVLDAAATEVYRCWDATLRLLGAATRRDLLVAMPGLLPAMERLGGPAALVETRDVVESVRRWWP